MVSAQIVPTPITPPVLPPLPQLPPIVLGDIPLPDISIGLPPVTIPQLDTSAMNPPGLAELGEKYGISTTPYLPYDASADIPKIDVNITSSPQAQKVIESTAEEIKKFQLLIDQQGILHQSLMDRGRLANETLTTLEGQRTQLAGLMQDYLAQISKLENEVKSNYQEIVVLKDGLQKLATQTTTSDPNLVRQQRQQVLNDHAVIATQFQSAEIERLRVQSELEFLKKEIDDINSSTQKIAELDYSSIGGNIPSFSFQAPIPTYGGPQLTPSTSFMAGPAIPGLTQIPVPDEDDEEDEEKKNRKRKSSKSSSKAKLKSKPTPPSSATSSTSGTKPSSATTSDKGKKEDKKEKKDPLSSQKGEKDKKKKK